MTAEQFDRLVKRYEAEAARNPQGYRLRVGLFAALGYGYIALLLLLALALVGGLIALIVYFPRAVGAHIKFTIPLALLLAGLSWTMIRSLLVRAPHPDGIEINRAQAPRLFAMIDGLRQELQTPPVHRVVITPEMNAAMYQRPRLGILGWYENYLILGLPLLQTLGRAHVRGVIAHELGHLSRQHSRFSHTIYRQVDVWANMLEYLERRQQRGDLLTRFFEWFMPRLSALSFPLRRQSEYEADRTAARLVGVQTYGEALCLLPIAARWFGEYWERVYNQVKHRHAPPEKPFHAVGVAFRSEWDSNRAAQWLQEAVNRPSDVIDTHPSLLERLHAVGYLQPSNDPLRPPPLPLPRPPDQSAAEYLLGPAEAALADRLETEWRAEIEPVWETQREVLRQTQEQVAQLQQKARHTPLSADELYTLAEGLARLQDKAQAIPLLQQVLQLEPNHASAHFLLGTLLLEQKNEAGVSYLERAMQLDPHCTEAASGLLYDHFMSKGDLQRAAAYRHRVAAYHDQLAAAQKERSGVTRRDQFLPHGLTPEQLQHLVQQLSAERGIVKAYLVRKQLQHFPEEPYLVLGITPRWSMTGRGVEKLLDRLTEEVVFPYPTFVMIFVGQYRPFEKIFRQIPGSLILSR